MPQLIWSPQALLDVQRLYRFLALKNQDAAKRAVTVIRQDVKVLSLQPGMGRPSPDMDDEFRDWIIDFGDSGYVARYRLDAQYVIILAVRHQKEAGF
ncbi:plasmid stabilization protein [Limnohabitans sp. 2KL-1]|jgi:plasmid stabilization system protein ParE|uniref:type II toxin-antitoxin system RelE/ParE family toxin n=1 Tax=Limnohabitans sp. 2KL-1 TaxID=1100699 RepID=UPI000D3A6CB8|nr:type II toxin-antitoxin system RelE/ParE family toxin [Limnohabitans sp. 2KL-1]PUE49051.1 plasmid stabilization protein [Limnohabitans sp. 2KL-1]